MSAQDFICFLALEQTDRHKGEPPACGSSRQLQTGGLPVALKPKGGGRKGHVFGEQGWMQKRQWGEEL